MLSEISQAEKDKYQMISLICGGGDEGGLQTCRLLDADIILVLDLLLGEQAR